MRQYLYTLLITLLYLASHMTVMAREQMIIPQWNTYKSDFREAVVDHNGVLTDTYTLQDTDTVNVIDTHVTHNYTLDITFTLTNLHNNSYTHYSRHYRDNSGKVRRGRSVQRPIYGWVVGMSDLLHYNAVLMRSTQVDDNLYSHAQVEVCIVTVNGSDTTYHTPWNKFSYDNTNYGDGTYTMWLQYRNGTLTVGSGWNVDMPIVSATHIHLYGSKTGLYLSAGAKVRVDDAMIIVEAQELPRMTQWNEEQLYNYFYNNTHLAPVEGLWEIILESRNKRGVKMGGDYRLAIVAHDDYFDIIYLSGANIHPGQWHEGMTKGRMYPQLSGTYRVEWFDAERHLINNILAFVYDYNIKLEFIDENTTIYLTRTHVAPDTTIPTVASGTGFALSSNGYIATNYHVVKARNRITVYRTHDNDITRGYNAHVVACDTVNDIAILRINDHTFTSLGDIPYNIANRTIRKGEEIFYMGYPVPLVLSTEIKTDYGYITAINGYSQSCYMMSVDIDHGSSGSPVFDTNGDVIGIVVSKLKEGLSSVEANFAIKTPYLHRLMQSIDDIDVAENKASAHKLKGLSHPDKIEAIAPYVFLIEVE